MRPMMLLLAAACVAGVAAQVNYAGQGGPGGQGGVVRRRRVRVRRPVSDNLPEQQGDSQTLVPFSLQHSPPPSRQQFRPEQQQFRPEQQQFRPEPQQFRPQFQQQRPDEFRSPQDFAPAPAKQQSRPKPQSRPSPQARPKPSPPSRSASRFQAQEEPEYADYAETTGTSAEEDYVEEPDRLNELLTVSTFKCDPTNTGYYADDSVNCEVFHYCSAGVKHSWVCPNGNSFHQINLICQPQSADNICQRSNEFTFVNDYLYQQISNDTRKPQYADRYYPDAAAVGDELLDRPAPQSAYQQRQPSYQQQQQEQQVRRQRPRAQIRPQSRPQSRPQPAASGNDYNNDGNDYSGASSGSFPDFRQAQAAAAARPSQGTRGRPEQRPFRSDQLGFQPQQGSFRRSGEESVLPPVRPDPFVGQVGASALRPDIRSRGVPQPEERHDDRIVLGGFQGNVDIEDLASRRDRQ